MFKTLQIKCNFFLFKSWNPNTIRYHIIIMSIATLSKHIILHIFYRNISMNKLFAWTHIYFLHIPLILRFYEHFVFYIYLSYLNVYSQLRTKLYDKRNDFNFPIVNFPLICSNIPVAPAYRIYISQLIRYSRAYGSYQDFLDRGLLLIWKLLNQWFLFVMLESFAIVTMTWLIVTEYLFHTWSRICST